MRRVEFRLRIRLEFFAPNGARNNENETERGNEFQGPNHYKLVRKGMSVDNIARGGRGGTGISGWDRMCDSPPSNSGNLILRNFQRSSNLLPRSPMFWNAGGWLIAPLC